MKLNRKKLKENAIPFEQVMKETPLKERNEIYTKAYELTQIMLMKKRREELGISQYQLEKMSGISRKTIIAIEQGKRNPTLQTLYALSEPLKMDIEIKFRK